MRRAGDADAPALARVNVAAWRRAYRGIVPDAVLDSLTPADREPGWRRGLALPEPTLSSWRWTPPDWARW